MAATSISVSIATSGRGWASAWRGRASGAQRTVKTAITEGCIATDMPGVLEVEFASDKAVQALNRAFRGKDKATNVLSFANPSRPFGSIILGYETIKREALEQGKPFSFHAKHMILHGFLHLIGYDHETVADRRLMERLEIRILAVMGIPNPYILTE